MQARFVVLMTLVAAALAVSLSSCGKSTPTTPTGTTQPHTLVSVSISGPSSVAPGATAQMKATAVYRDNANVDVTTTAMWQSSNPSVLSISGTGVASGLALGEATITVWTRDPAALNLSSSLNMLVVPAGTHRLTGSVLDEGMGVAGASVEVVAGQGKGLSTLSGFNGDYHLYGVAGDVQVQASKTGYVTQVKPLGITANAILDFNLSLIDPRPDVSGSYQLSIKADASCPATGSFPLPDDGRFRQYTAMVSQSGEKVDVTLSGADFALKGGEGNHFSGRVQPGVVSFTLYGANDYYYYHTYYSLIEKLADGRLFTASGTVTATLSAGALAGTLNGAIEIRSSPAVGPSIGTCYSLAHQFVLSQQASPASRRVRR